MPARAFLNGQPWEFAPTATADWRTWGARLTEHLAQRGWELHRLRVDGVETTLAGAPTLTDAEHRIDVEAGPQEVDLADVAQRLHAALPMFRAQLTEVGAFFSRGDWRSGLTRLPDLLEDLRLAFGGLRIVYAARSEGPPDQLARVPEVLQGLSRQIELQSWVEVSDCILYELVPLLEQWSTTSLERD